MTRLRSGLCWERWDGADTLVAHLYSDEALEAVDTVIRLAPNARRLMRALCGFNTAPSFDPSNHLEATPCPQCAAADKTSRLP